MEIVRNADPAPRAQKVTSTLSNIYEVDSGVPVTVRDLKMHLLGKGDRCVLPIADQQHK